MSSPIQAGRSQPNVGKSEKEAIAFSVLERDQSSLESLPLISDPVNSGAELGITYVDNRKPNEVKAVPKDASDVVEHPDLARIASPQETIENTEAPNGSLTNAADKTEASKAPLINAVEKNKAIEMSKVLPIEGTAASGAQAMHPTSEDPKPERESETMIQTPRYVDFEGFKNVYNSNDKGHVLDVLLTGANYTYEVWRLRKIRMWLQDIATAAERKIAIASISGGSTSKRERTRISRVRIQSPGVIFHLANVSGETWTTSVPRTFARPFQVMIYFQPRMKEILVKLKARLQHKKEPNPGAAKTAASDHIMMTTVIEPFPREGTAAFQVNDDEDNLETDAKQNPDMYDDQTLRAMQCYTDFVDEKIMPLYYEYEGTSKTKIRFEDLSYLFRLGDLVYASPSSDVRPDRRYETSLSQSSLVWKIYTLINPSVKRYPSFEATRHTRKPRSHQDDDGDDDDDGNTRDRAKAFRVWAYYIDHDGTSYGPVKHCFNIAPFEGEMEITALPCYPARFVDDPDLVKTLQHEGAKFRDCITKRHLSYDGWTASSMPMGGPIVLDEGGKRTKNPEYIESHVIVDFAETFQAYPFWKPAFHEAKAYSDDGWSDETDDYGIYDIETNHISTEILQRNDGVDMWLRKDYLEHDRFINDYKAYVAPTKPGKEKKGIELNDESLVLLPRRIFAYILRDRKFSVLDVRFLDFIQPQQEVFAQLKIPRQYKDIVKGLVSSHFVRKKLEREFSSLSTADKLDVLQSSGALTARDLPQTADESHGMGTAEITGVATHGLTQDVIQGKGRGLVVLLHGVPGVGKTATAEAVALENRKPLFVITCGDLGLAPNDVETHLTEVFRLAHLWDCVLLLDEADVFLAARNNYDLNRNALVSVFLRVLEYYSGILFLTTNRVGTLDEAFKSRIHISLYYPSLRKTQAVMIFEVNIARLKKIAATRSLIAKEPQLVIDEVGIINFAHSLFAKAEAQGKREWTPWNGRQIRNAFQIASALAYNHMHSEYAELLKRKERGEIEHAECPVPVLNAQHFKVVDTVTDEFDWYMYEARGKSDASRAHLSGERADDHTANSDLGLSEIGYAPTSEVRRPPRTPESYRSREPAENQVYLDSGPVLQRHGADAPRDSPRGPAHHHYERDSRLDEDYRAKKYPYDSTTEYDSRGQNVSRARVLDHNSTSFVREERSVGDSMIFDSVSSLRRDRSPHNFMRDSVSGLSQDRNNRLNTTSTLGSRPLTKAQHHDRFTPPSPSPYPTAGASSLLHDDNMDQIYD